MPNKKKCCYVCMCFWTQYSAASQKIKFSEPAQQQTMLKCEIHNRKQSLMSTHTCILFNHICGIFACLNITTLHICWFHSIASYSHCDFSNIESRVLVHVSMGSICVCTKCIRSKEKKLWLSKAMQIEVTFRT